MPKFKIAGWTYTTQSTERSEWQERGGQFAPIAERTKIHSEETVRAVFEVVDPEPIKKYGNSKIQQVPRSLVVSLVSNDGGPWRKVRSGMIAFNLKASGELGAQSDLDEIHYPDWAKEFVGAYFGGEPGTELEDWINEAYPR